jgi:LmbE family N-acetylglucosaminyl deacetylase
MLSSGAMTHVFISPHPDDAALSCGGLIASLRELGQNVAIVSVFSGGPREADP